MKLSLLYSDRKEELIEDGGVFILKSSGHFDRFFNTIATTYSKDEWAMYEDLGEFPKNDGKFSDSFEIHGKKFRKSFEENGIDDNGTKFSWVNYSGFVILEFQILGADSMIFLLERI